MMKWLRLGLIVIAVLLFAFQAYSYFSIDYVALKKSVRQPFERQFIEFDQESYENLKEMDSGKRIRNLRRRDFGRGEIFLPD